MMGLMARLAAICLIWLCAAQGAQAQSCSVRADDVEFGAVDVLGSTPATAVGGIAITCSTLVGLFSSVAITVHLGNGSGGLSGAMRKMTHGQTASGLVYQLYGNSGHTEVIGGTNGTHGGTPLTNSGGSLLQLLSNSTYTIPIYGQVLAGQGSVVPHPTVDYMSTFTGTTANVKVEIRTCALLSVLLCSTDTFSPSFAVRARVLPDCRVEADDMDFGPHGLLSQDLTATSVIDVKCTLGTSFNVGLNYGIAGTGISGRYMRSTLGKQVRYQLYKDAERTQPWGLPADGATFIDTGTGSTRGMTVYGVVPAQTTPPPGAYSDTVTVTVTY